VLGRASGEAAARRTGLPRRDGDEDELDEDDDDDTGSVMRGDALTTATAGGRGGVDTATTGTGVKRRAFKISRGPSVASDFLRLSDGDREEGLLRDWSLAGRLTAARERTATGSESRENKGDGGRSVTNGKPNTTCGEAGSVAAGTGGFGTGRAPNEAENLATS
jgi:hypothetical protein